MTQKLQATIVLTKTGHLLPIPNSFNSGFCGWSFLLASGHSAHMHKPIHTQITQIMYMSYTIPHSSIILRSELRSAGEMDYSLRALLAFA